MTQNKANGIILDAVINIWRIIDAIIAATTSSANTKNAPFFAFILFIGNGFVISNKRNKQKPIMTQVIFIGINGDKNNSQTPMASSITTKPGSDPLLCSISLIIG